MCHAFNIPKCYGPLLGAQRKKHDACKGGERVTAANPFLLSEWRDQSASWMRVRPAQCIFGNPSTTIIHPIMPITKPACHAPLLPQKPGVLHPHGPLHPNPNASQKWHASIWQSHATASISITDPPPTTDSCSSSSLSIYQNVTRRKKR